MPSDWRRAYPPKCYGLGWAGLGLIPPATVVALNKLICAVGGSSGVPGGRVPCNAPRLSKIPADWSWKPAEYRNLLDEYYELSRGDNNSRRVA